MKNKTAHYLADYQSPDYIVETVELIFDIHDTYTDVTSKMRIRANTLNNEKAALILNGNNLELQSVILDEAVLSQQDFTLEADKLIIKQTPLQFYLTVKTRIYPHKNKALSGLYCTNKLYCTQCESHGFSNITYYIDRPDVMAIFTTTIIADQKKYPVLLSNGNLIETGHAEKGRHWAKWHDPFKKPAYLFALVAGDLACNSAVYTTISGRQVTLNMYTEHENKNKCEHALMSLQRAMRWDETAFGLEYDLDIYMIVAVNDFNMGAMENKGLNIFNSKYILANPAIATDTDYQDIEKVVGHEYFHNWTGNRVTLRDWFQLSLKEGLTVFREQEFFTYHWSPAVKRIQDVQIIRNAQFPQDAGPLAHPVRPDSYIEMNNFYTVTVYQKGAEVIRMLYRLFGASGFRYAMDLYFSRFDGHAVTIDDFIQAFSDANHYDLTQFKLWYSQAGTPVLEIKWEYDKKQAIWTLTVEQSCPSTPNQEKKLPFNLPLVIALLDKNGKEMPLHLLEGEQAPNQDEFTLNITQRKQQFRFGGVKSEPIPSLLRGFSAPVKLKTQHTQENLLFLFVYDTDPVAAWDAGQQVILNEAQCLIDAYSAKKPIQINPVIIDGLTKALERNLHDPAYVALLLQLPDQNMLADQQTTVDVDVIYHVYRELHLQLATHLQDKLLALYKHNSTHMAYHVNPGFVAKRSLKNTCLRYLGRLNTPQTQALIREQYYRADNMTDRLAALQAINHVDAALRDELLADFAIAWKHEPLVLDKWFALQAVSELPNAAERVKALLTHAEFLLENPNKLYALLGTFSQHNAYNFHDISGAGYRFFTDEILRIDKFNPQVAARLASAFSSWRRYDENRRKLLKTELERILETSGLSADVYEIVSKCLA